MDFKPKIGQNKLQEQSAGDIVGNHVDGTVADTIFTPYQTPNKPIPAINPKIDKRNYKKNLKLRLYEHERINSVKRVLFPSKTKSEI